jgi:hypothetical protein
MCERTKKRTSVSRAENGQLLFLRESGYFVGRQSENWVATDKIKVADLASTTALINLAPRQPRNVKREYQPRFRWLRDFVAHIDIPEEAPKCAS